MTDRETDRQTDRQTDGIAIAYARLAYMLSRAKIVLKILTRRLEGKVQKFLGRDQYGFRSGRGTRDTIAALRVLYERSLEFNNKVYTCYVDFEKAFDRIDWSQTGLNYHRSYRALE